MLIVDGIVVSEELLQVMFTCHLDKCHGACCVEGDAGAPLLPEEIGDLEDNWESAIPYMTEKGIETIRTQGVFDYDEVGNFVTPLIEGRECAYVFFEGEVARCALEKAWSERKSSFQKPQSCHLYPIRVGKGTTGDHLIYHKWHICKPALKNGKSTGLRLYQFLKEPLIRRYGELWYQKLEASAAGYLNREKKSHP
ncbi:MAG: DUF3109 family protein [Bacteroidales bacterium]